MPYTVNSPIEAPPPREAPPPFWPSDLLGFWMFLDISPPKIVRFSFCKKPLKGKNVLSLTIVPPKVFPKGPAPLLGNLRYLIYAQALTIQWQEKKKKKKKKEEKKKKKKKERKLIFKIVMFDFSHSPMSEDWANFLRTRTGNCIVLQKPLAAGKPAIPAQVFYLFSYNSGNSGPSGNSGSSGLSGQ